MPGLDGIQLCKNIKKTNSNSVVYALSGYIDSFQADMLEKNGFDGYLRKPVDTFTLHKAIDGAFDKVLRNFQSVKKPFPSYNLQSKSD